MIVLMVSIKVKGKSSIKTTANKSKKLKMEEKISVLVQNSRCYPEVCCFVSMQSIQIIFCRIMVDLLSWRGSQIIFLMDKLNILVQRKEILLVFSSEV